MTSEVLRAAAGVPPDQSLNSRDGVFFYTLTFHTVERRVVLALVVSSPCLSGHWLPRVLVRGFNGQSLNVWASGISAGLHAAI